MLPHTLSGAIGLFTSACTVVVVVLAIRVIVPRRRKHRPIRVPLTVGIAIAALGLVADTVNLVAALTS
ncbi:hypothetical protein [Amnibacterium kyonggiense]